MASTLPFRQEINQNGEWDMARVNRREVLSDGEIQVVHCVNRCVRRGFLCGVDELTGKNYEHRRQWMRNRLEFLAGIFAADVLGFSVMSNHLHVILRNRPDVVKTWSDAEVARRWWNLFPQRRNKDGSPAEPADTELNHLMANAETLAELRARLSSISWFMRCTSEVIARMANAEDECTGRFWEGRFKTTVLLDESAIAACMAYVDLNPIRAGLASTPETSNFTSVQERIADLKSADDVSTPDSKDSRIEHGERAGWLAPVELEPKRKKIREKCSSRRASNKGCLFMTLTEYLQLLDWTGRQLKTGKRGTIPKNAPPILDRLNLSVELWLHAVEHFSKRRSANRPTPASRFNATAKSTVSAVSTQ
jgi:REP element-mobilizing transposase RayT